MNTYNKKSWWKIALMIIGMIIIVFTLVYTNYLSKRLAENEQKYITFYKSAIESIRNDQILSDPNSQLDFSLELQIIDYVKNPILMDEGDTLVGYNWPADKDTDIVFLKKQLEKMKKSGVKPFIPGVDDDPLTPDPKYPKIYYKQSTLYTLITWFPLVQVFLIGMFILLGYMVFSSMRRAEQNLVWVGMSKETAHQLGTPISGIMGWLQYLEEATDISPEQKDAINELKKDVGKLDLIADRFSKIGSRPDLHKRNINDTISNSVEYLKKRSPKNVKYVFDNSSELYAMINDHLFSWVVENILKNALDAMGNQGTISIHTSKENNKIIIDITDTGKGIPSGKLKTVFNPGYSTKKRGWGLGLSLSKRIITEYHKGKIFVLKSKVNEGTTFRIILPEA
ncbi:MAG TPA: HAMP domain-containing histidine kinase [Bacteroidetes bacterium]|nr:HAMP domain-containing histidine kinase [Bacteroidota bacterium]